MGSRMRCAHPGVSVWLPCAPLLVLALSPLVSVGAVDWSTCLQISCICVGLGLVLLRRSRIDGVGNSDSAGVVLALGFLYVLSRFGWDEWPIVGKWGALALIALACVVALRETASRPSRSELLATTVAGGLVCTILVAHLSSGWTSIESVVLHVMQIGASLLLLISVTRLTRGSPARGRRLAVALIVGLAVVAIVGLLQMSSIVYYRMHAENARDRGDTLGAMGYLASGLGVASSIGLEGQIKSMNFRTAAARFADGDEEQAAAAVGLRKGFIDVMPADAWSGPEGGNLYYEVSCWKSLYFLPGHVELVVYASGNEVRGEWPEMRVELDGEFLGSVWVTSVEPAPYRFAVNIAQRSVKRLSVHFVNDLFQTTPHLDRNLLVDRVEVHYLRIDWDE